MMSLNLLYPTISIVITTFKRPQMICDAVDNCLAQTYPNLEIIVIDDNGIHTEYQLKTQINLQKYIDDRTIKYFPLEENGGACLARNYGADKSTGKYIAFFDDDDEWTLDKIFKQYEKFQNSDENIGIVVCGQKIIDAKTKKILASFTYKTLKENPFNTILNSSSCIAGPNPLYLKTAFQSVNGFTKDLKSSQDLDIALKITKKYPIGIIDKACHIVKLHKGERISSNHENKISGFNYILKQYGDDMNDRGKLFYLQRILMHCYYGNFPCEIKNYTSQLKSVNGFSIKYRIFYLGTKIQLLRILLNIYLHVFAKQ